MEINHLKNFIAIVEEGSMSAAAKKIFVAQPALSNQLKALEKELGTTLLRRNSRKVELTDAGKIFYGKAKHIIDLEEAARKEVTDCVSGLTGTLHIGMTLSTSSTFFDGILFQFHQQNPGIKFQLYEAGSLEILELLRSRIIEIGIVRTPFPASPDLQITYVDQEPMAAVYSLKANFFPASKENLTIRDLNGKPLCVIRRFEKLLTDACLNAGFQPDLLCVNTQLMTCIQWAKESMAIAVVPASLLQSISTQEMRCHKLSDTSLYTQRAIITLHHHYISQAAQKFLETCRQSLEH